MWTKRNGNVDQKKCGQKEMWTNVDLLSPRVYRFVHLSFCFWQHTIAHKYWQCDCAERWPLVNPWNVFLPIWFFVVFYFLQHAPTVCGVVQDLDSSLTRAILFCPYLFGHMDVFERWSTTSLLWTISDFWSARLSSLHTVEKNVDFRNMIFWSQKWIFDWRWGSVNQMQGSFDRV